MSGQYLNDFISSKLPKDAKHIDKCIQVILAKQAKANKLEIANITTELRLSDSFKYLVPIRQCMETLKFIILYTQGQKVDIKDFSKYEKFIKSLQEHSKDLNIENFNDIFKSIKVGKTTKRGKYILNEVLTDLHIQTDILSNLIIEDDILSYNQFSLLNEN